MGHPRIDADRTQELLPQPPSGAASEAERERGPVLPPVSAAPPPSRRPLNLAAFAFVTAGLVVTLLAWRGAASTPLVFEQIPYAISGGLLSVALIALGGMLAVAELIIRLSDQRRTRDRQLRAGVEKLRTRLVGR